MSLEGCAKVIKYMVFCFNLVFWIVGCSILAIGIYVRLSDGEYAVLTESIPFANVSNLMIAVGAIITIIGFVGCVGAWKENKCLLMTFFILLLIIFLMEIVIGVLGYIYRNEVSGTIEQDLLSQMSNYGEDGHDGLTDGWDRLQNEEKCCGVYNYTDWWVANPSWNLTKLPDSCCVKHTIGCGTFTPESFSVGDFSDVGCGNALQTIIESNLYLIGGVAIAVAVIQLLGLIFSLALFCEVRKEGKYV